MILLVLIFAAVVQGKIYDRCELARELKYVHGAPSHQLATWVCIAEHESQYNTSIVGYMSGDGSGDHGIFQINDKFWCSPPGKGFACDLTCAELEDDNIADDYICAQKIYKEHKTLSGDGFNAWAVYKPYCKGSKADRYIKDCFNDFDGPKPHVAEVSTTPPSLFAHGFFGTAAGRDTKAFSVPTLSSDAFYTPPSSSIFSESSFYSSTPRTTTSFVTPTSRPATNRFFLNPTTSPSSSFVPLSSTSWFLGSTGTSFTPSTFRSSIFTSPTSPTVYQSSAVNSLANEPVFIINGVKWY